MRKSPFGYIPLFGKYYKAYTNDTKDFYGALEVCQKEEGTLLEYRTDDEFKAAKIMLGQCWSNEQNSCRILTFIEV